MPTQNLGLEPDECRINLTAAFTQPRWPPCRARTEIAKIMRMVPWRHERLLDTVHDGIDYDRALQISNGIVPIEKLLCIRAVVGASELLIVRWVAQATKLVLGNRVANSVELSTKVVLNLDMALLCGVRKIPLSTSCGARSRM